MDVVLLNWYCLNRMSLSHSLSAHTGHTWTSEKRTGWRNPTEGQDIGCKKRKDWFRNMTNRSGSLDWWWSRCSKRMPGILGLPCLSFSSNQIDSMLISDGSDQEHPYQQRDDQHQKKDVGRLIDACNTKPSDETEIHRVCVLEIRPAPLHMVLLAIVSRLMAYPRTSFPDPLTWIDRSWVLREGLFLDGSPVTLVDGNHENERDGQHRDVGQGLLQVCIYLSIEYFIPL